MEQDNRTYPGYMARLIGLIVAIILFGLAIWFVVQLTGNDETGVVVTLDDDDAPYSITNDLLNGDEVVVTDTTMDTTVIEDEPSWATIANADDKLPDTGASETTLITLLVSAVIISGYKFIVSKRELKAAV